MNKYQKLLRKISHQDRERIITAVHLIEMCDFSSLHNIKKLSATENKYRLRIGDFRIFFRIHKDYNEILDIDRRDDNTYSKL